jgi:hypothetical protein
MVNVITRRRSLGIAIAGTVLATLALSSSAHATTYYACVKKKGGSIRLVASVTRCRHRERKISFNSQGVPGKQGANGSKGSPGKNGTNGSNGANGASGFTSTLPAGATEKGTWAMEIPSASSGSFSAISFNIPLAGAPKANLMQKGAGSSAACPGKPNAPAAATGNLCVYVSTNSNTTLELLDPSVEGGITNGASPWGTTVEGFTEASSPGVAYGTWAVTG